MAGCGDRRRGEPDAGRRAWQEVAASGVSGRRTIGSAGRVANGAEDRAADESGSAVLRFDYRWRWSGGVGGGGLRRFRRVRTVMGERQAPGGQAGTSSRIENYLGFPSGLSGADLARRAVTQARRFGVETLAAEAVGLRCQDSYRFVQLADGNELSSHVILIA